MLRPLSGSENVDPSTNKIYFDSKANRYAELVAQSADGEKIYGGVLSADANSGIDSSNLKYGVASAPIMGFLLGKTYQVYFIAVPPCPEQFQGISGTFTISD